MTHLGDRYGGVIVNSHVNTDETGLVKPANPGMLKERFEEVGGVEGNTKIGLTTEGYVAFRCHANGRIGYYTMVIRPDGASAGRYTYREFRNNLSHPHDGFGSGWYVSPD